MDRYTFESRESYEMAVKEEELIQQLKKKADLKNNNWWRKKPFQP